MLTVGAVVEHLERLAPTRLAADWDNVGLLLGDAAGPVRSVMTCLTVTPESAAEAVEAKAELIVSHHPILFRGVKRLTDAGAAEEGEHGEGDAHDGDVDRQVVGDARAHAGQHAPLVGAPKRRPAGRAGGGLGGVPEL